ncbi:MAG TPA: thioesterase family protein [Acidimicrobiales bacterium]|jgi:acyl-CoA thioesterase|nr:thioesterase family protein [Acidimicrobiales bacterium]
MGNLADDTVVEGGDGRYQATLSADWNIWGPNGGYLAAIALRAAGAHSPQPRPASLLCHFVGVAEFAPVDLAVTTLRSAKRAESVRVSMTQQGQPVLEALVWTVADDLAGIVHDAAPAPGVPAYDDLRPADELRPPEAPRFAFWDNIEQRAVDYVVDWDNRVAAEPEFMGWLRFRPQATFEDPYVDAARLAIVVDTLQWPAAARGHDGSMDFVAPSLDLACLFHRPPADEPWLLVRATSPAADGGLVGGTACVWDAAGRLLASGSQQMLCRPAAPAHRPR